VDAYHHYKRIQITKETAEAGVQEVSGYVLSSKFPEVTKVNTVKHILSLSLLYNIINFRCIYIQNQFLEDLLPVYRRANELELKICPGDWKYGAFFTTLVIESRYHLPWLRNKYG
jgi:D-aspartate oxidase